MESTDFSSYAGTELGWVWLAGIYEGEGCCTATYSATRRPTWLLSIKMTDEDTVRDLQEIAGGLGTVYADKPRRSPEGVIWKDSWTWRVFRRDEVQFLLQKMRPWLHSRRGAKADEVLAYFRDNPPGLNSDIANGRKKLVLADYRKTGDTQWVLARRHGVSRSLVQQILANEFSPNHPRRLMRTWTPSEDAVLHLARAERRPALDVAAELNRPVQSVHDRAKYLRKIHVVTDNNWRPQEARNVQ
jgi:hypothetical protein